MFAVISDIHGNLEALEAVLADIDRRNIKTLFCLGDIVGYGAAPAACIDLIMERSLACLCGNHDQAVFYEPVNFNVGAERACYWTRQVLEDESKKSLRDARWEFLGRLPNRLQRKDLLMVHGSPRRPVNEYLFAEDVYTNPQKVLANFERLGEQHMACLVGHTHVPGVFLDDPYFDPPDELPDSGIYEITEDEKAVVNVGSVGQPRDGDARAGYVIFYEPGDIDPAAVPDEDNPDAPLPKIEVGNGKRLKAQFARVEYDVEKAVEKILAVPELDDFLGHRLFEGK